MKNTIKLKAIQRIAAMLRIAIIAIVAVIGFAMMGCGNPSGPGPGPDDTLPPTTAFSVSGAFTKVGGGEVQFSMTDAASAARSIRSITADSYAIIGELEDGDIIFRLSGTYDPVALTYTASSASSLIRYSINGAFNEDGESLGSTATLLVRDNNTSDDWTAFSYVINETAAVNITGTESTETVSGIPAFARGWWSYAETWAAGPGNPDGATEGSSSMDTNVLLSEWTIVDETVYTAYDGSKEFNSFSASVVDVENMGTYYNMIMGYPVYAGTQAQVEAAAGAFLIDKGLTAQLLDEPPMYMSGSYWWYVSDDKGYGGHIPDEAYEDIFKSIDLFNMSAEDIRTFVRQYLSDNGITAEELSEPPDLMLGPSYWYDAGMNDISWAGFSPSQWNIISQWYMTNYLERHLIDAGVAPQTKYLKLRVSFSNSNTRMTIAYYGTPVTEHGYTWYDGEVNSVAAARAFTQFDPDGLTLTR